MESNANDERDPEAEAEDHDSKRKALRLKALAEANYKSSNLKSALRYAKRAHSLFPDLEGLPEMVTTLRILRVAAKSSSDHYKILRVEPFAHINTIKKQYKKLAFTLHPDRNPYCGSEEAFKLVGESFRLLSDRARRKDYDMKLRIRMQEEAVAASGNGDDAAIGTFWTACSSCCLSQQFDKKYLGCDLVCPACNKSFKAVEAEAEGHGGEEEERAGDENKKVTYASKAERMRALNVKGKPEATGRDETREVSGEWGGGRLRKRASSVLEVLGKSRPAKKPRAGEDMMTLAEMKLEMKRKVNQQKEKLGLQLKKKVSEENVENRKDKEKIKNEREKKGGEKEKENEGDGRGVLNKLEHSAAKSQGALKKTCSDIGRLGRSNKSDSSLIERKSSTSEQMEIMTVEDSDFYDFDKDRTEKCFKKGQVWAVYDDDDGMPRHYGLIDEILSANPFKVQMCWLDLQNSGDERFIFWEKMGCHISCGRFKVGRKTFINSVNIFSHVVDSERAAREVYRIYPKKGSVWALYNEANLSRDERCYDIVVLLTTYSELNGLSIAYLEKVDGFRTIFKRREIGCHAIRWLGEDGLQLFSHQIPARKLTGNEVPDLLKDCWELDPASLPSVLLTIT